MSRLVHCCAIACLASLVFLLGIEVKAKPSFDLWELERPRVMTKAELYLHELPVTVTAHRSERSLGSIHDFYSEGDYWWPNPDDPDGPYVRRDGQTNPDNFVAHRRSMIRLSEIIGTLTSAYLLTDDNTYAAHAVRHLKAWFVDSQTKMSPHLLYGQAITGRDSGRPIGIIDTLHLIEVARGAKLLSGSLAFTEKDQQAVQAWFRQYLLWLNTHEFGLKEKMHPNNHGICWSLQAAVFADLVGDAPTLNWVRQRFKRVYLKKMMDRQGGFPAELARTKPYSYSLFVIDAMAALAQVVSTNTDNLWTYRTPMGRGLIGGRSMALGMAFIFPYIENKAAWPLKPDVMYWEQWPVRQPSLLFAGLNLERQDYLHLWSELEPDPTNFEVLRNLPVRHPLLWVERHQSKAQ